MSDGPGDRLWRRCTHEEPRLAGSRSWRVAPRRRPDWSCDGWAVERAWLGDRGGSVVGAEDRPGDLGVPLVGVGGLSDASEVVLAERSVDADLVLHHVCAEFPVGQVDIAEGAVVPGDRELGAGNQQ